MKTTASRLIIHNERTLPLLFGDLDRNLKLIESIHGVELKARGNRLQIEGREASVADVERLVTQLEEMLTSGTISSKEEVRDAIQAHAAVPSAPLAEVFGETVMVSGRKRPVLAKNETQRKYIDAIKHADVVFGIGPAGTGKTYLAMAMAASALLAREVSRIILVRPAVEAGEKLGFLPGTLYEKINPYLRPLYDALYDMIDTEKANKLVERGDIEIAPLAFMRGRILNDSFIILDEAQNTTSEQMKMFLTRLGFNSKTVVTGDVTQIDLPGGRGSGLVEVQKILTGIEGIRFVNFTRRDVVRHRLVQQIIKAYETSEEQDGER
jgi:phosphate starvation-inducible PhoH-like protein